MACMEFCISVLVLVTRLDVILWSHSPSKIESCSNLYVIKFPFQGFGRRNQISACESRFSGRGSAQFLVIWRVIEGISYLPNPHFNTPEQ